METPLLLALWSGTILFMLTYRLAWSALLLCLAPTARSEALIILPVLAALAGLMVLRGRLEKRRLAWLALLPAPMLVWSLFCKFTNGRWLPTIFYMKFTSPELGLEQMTVAWKLLGLNGPMPSLAIALLLILSVVLLLRTGRNLESVMFMLTSPAVFMLGILFSREFFPEGSYWPRWTDPAAMLLTAVAAIGMGGMAVQPGLWKCRIAVMLLALLSLPHFVQAITGWKSRLASDCRAINLITVQAGKWMDENLPVGAVIAVNDAGATRYFGKRRTIDLMGLNCADIAFGTADEEDRGIVDYLA
jgi:hypothetical protein